MLYGIVYTDCSIQAGVSARGAALSMVHGEYTQHRRDKVEDWNSAVRRGHLELKQKQNLKQKRHHKICKENKKEDRKSKESSKQQERSGREWGHRISSVGQNQSET